MGYYLDGTHRWRLKALLPKKKDHRASVGDALFVILYGNEVTPTRRAKQDISYRKALLWDETYKNTKLG